MRLTREQRSACYRGEYPRLRFPGDKPCPVKAGETLPIGKKFWLEITEIRRSRMGEHVAAYTVFDHRNHVRCLRRTPSILSGEYAEIRRSYDETGMPPAPTAEAIRQAAEESAYAGGGEITIEDAGEAVDAKDQRILTAEAHERAEMSPEQRRRDAKARLNRLQDIERRARSQGLDLTPLHQAIDREIIAWQAKVEEAA